MKIAITGANGFLGTHLVNKFLSKDYTVFALLRKTVKKHRLPRHENLVLVFVDYDETLTQQFKKIKEAHGELDYFLHNAGLTVSGDTKEYYEINKGLTEKITQTLDESGWLHSQGKILYISSMAAKGPMQTNSPVSHYGMSKLQAEKVIKNNSNNHLIFRPTGIYGIGDKAFLPLFKLAHKGFYPLTNKNQKMSMINAQDLASMVVAETPISIGILHASDQKTYTHQDFITALTFATDKKLKPLSIPLWISKWTVFFHHATRNLFRKKPELTLEKFNEISMDWNLHDLPNIRFSTVPCPTTLKQGFKRTYDFYKQEGIL